MGMLPCTLVSQLGAVVSVAKRAMHCRWQTCIETSILQGNLSSVSSMLSILQRKMCSWPIQPAQRQAGSARRPTANSKGQPALQF